MKQSLPSLGSLLDLKTGVSHIAVPLDTEQAELSYVAGPPYWSRDRHPRWDAVELWPRGALTTQGQLRECAPTARTNTAGHTAVPGGSAAPGAELRWWSSTIQGVQAWFPLTKTPQVQARPFSRSHTPACPRKDAVTQSERGAPVSVQGVPEPGAALKSEKCRSLVAPETPEPEVRPDKGSAAELRGEVERPRSTKRESEKVS